MIALNGVDFVRTQLTYKYYTQPYNITHMAPVTGGNKDGGTTITLFGRGFHEFEGKKTPRLARCRWTDGRTTDDTLAIYLSGSQLRCPTPSKPEPATHDLLVSLNSFDYDPTYFKFTFYTLEPSLSRRVDFAMHASIDEVPHGSPAQDR